MALEATHVTVAGNGAVYVAPEGTALPADLVTPLPVAWEDVGYIGEDGVQFSLSRDQEEINAWQSAEPVRVLVTNEPKTITFELLEFDKTAILLAFRGGSIAGTTPPYTYTPPDPGASDVRAMTIDGFDGTEHFRFAFPRVSLTGDVEFSLVRTDAVRLPLEFSVLASATKWQLIADLDGFTAAAGYADMTVAELQREADARDLATSGTKAELIDRLTADDATT